MFCLNVVGPGLTEEDYEYLFTAALSMMIHDRGAVTLMDNAEEIGVITRLEKHSRYAGMSGSIFEATFGGGRSVTFFVRRQQEEILVAPKKDRRLGSKPNHQRRRSGDAIPGQQTVH